MQYPSKDLIVTLAALGELGVCHCVYLFYICFDSCFGLPNHLLSSRHPGQLSTFKVASPKSIKAWHATIYGPSPVRRVD